MSAINSIICAVDPSQCSTTDYNINLEGLFHYALCVDIYPSLLEGQFDPTINTPDWVAHQRQIYLLFYIIGLEMFVEIINYLKK